MNCSICGTPIYDIDEPCPHCLPKMAWRPDPLAPNPCPSCASLRGNYERIYGVNRTLEDTIISLRLRLAAAEKALEFYADPKSYFGPNQRAEEGEENIGGYRIDVTRDGGEKARRALTPKEGG